MAVEHQRGGCQHISADFQRYLGVGDDVVVPRWVAPMAPGRGHHDVVAAVEVIGLLMRTDGELILDDTAHPAFGAAARDGGEARLWTAGTRSEAGASLQLGDDGTLFVVTTLGQMLWRSGNASPDVGLVGARHVVYDRGSQWVWLIDADGRMVDSYPVSGHPESPLPGRYSVTSKSEDAISYNRLVTMEHMVRFTTDEDGDYIGFHSIPRGWRDTPVQTEAQLGDFLSLGCVRQRDDEAERLFEWASIGTAVVVIA